MTFSEHYMNVHTLIPMEGWGVTSAIGFALFSESFSRSPLTMTLGAPLLQVL